ncbi:MAG: hypothetical protein CBB97_11680 [Candidatus Endolissoclinum sp. TMED37]|nr:MAG: hypothetical protein CBB97_11680 [Candidatus Endolissoclinum sp. TMED37]|tara:strand:- start:263 stop:550 length:288 start_codon:yes stop_codon:yes gene_type:complete
MANNVKVTVGGARNKSVVTARTSSVATVSTASKIKVGKLEDNVGNLDVGNGLDTGETLVYNASTQKWEATDLADSISNVLEGDTTLLGNIDGGAY